MDESKLIFLTGAPGSKWSAVSWVLSEALPVNKTDRTPDRLMVHKEAYNGVRHTGVYFGPGMELGHNFHRVNELSKEEILSEIQKGWPTWDDNLYHIVRCHQFINNFDWLVGTFSSSKFVVVTRRPEQCVAGWMSVGGIDIPYPIYKDYYVDNDNAERLINKKQCWHKEHSGITRWILMWRAVAISNVSLDWKLQMKKAILQSISVV